MAPTPIATLAIRPAGGKKCAVVALSPAAFTNQHEIKLTSVGFFFARRKRSAMEILLALAILAGLSVVIATVFHIWEWLSDHRMPSKRGKNGR
ncbi:hypothetical protein DDT56_21610 [Brenneria corticis]|uniref:Uncharacterized protein n=1 Tax=Brenneria corticis TaxID=2173106 RepID=A0A2U1TM65_9GAMM|nr:hypothetical protein DDT56_21610 [Brenneria sp. CFCC 11842]